MYSRKCLCLCIYVWMCIDMLYFWSYCLSEFPKCSKKITVQTKNTTKQNKQILWLCLFESCLDFHGTICHKTRTFRVVSKTRVKLGIHKTYGVHQIGYPLIFLRPQEFIFSSWVIGLTLNHKLDSAVHHAPDSPSFFGIIVNPILFVFWTYSCSLWGGGVWYKLSVMPVNCVSLRTVTRRAYLLSFHNTPLQKSLEWLHLETSVLSSLQLGLGRKYVRAPHSHVIGLSSWQMFLCHLLCLQPLLFGTQISHLKSAHLFPPKHTYPNGYLMICPFLPLAGCQCQRSAIHFSWQWLLSSFDAPCW